MPARRKTACRPTPRLFRAAPVLYWSAGFTAGTWHHHRRRHSGGRRGQRGGGAGLQGRPKFHPNRSSARTRTFILLSRWSPRTSETAHRERHPLLRNLRAVRENRVIAIEGSYLTSVSQYVVRVRKAGSQAAPGTLRRQSPHYLRLTEGEAMSRPVFTTGILAAAYLGLAVLGTAWGTVPIPPAMCSERCAGAAGWQCRGGAGERAVRGPAPALAASPAARPGRRGPGLFRGSPPGNLREPAGRPRRAGGKRRRGCSVPSWLSTRVWRKPCSCPYRCVRLPADWGLPCWSTP